MRQISLGDGFEMSAKRTKTFAFLEEMERIVIWMDLVAVDIIFPYRAQTRIRFVQGLVESPCNG